MELILASTSPRRIELMALARIPVRVIAPGCEEIIRRGELPVRMVRRLAAEKAESVLALQDARGGATVIIAADTTVVAPGGRRILGKPDDVRQAEQMLRSLSGRTHEVLTGYCILARGEDGRIKKRMRVVRSAVTMRKVSPAMIRDYVATGEPMDKAGSYAAQGFGMNWIRSIRGSYTNVVGLPMCELLTDLEEHFGILPTRAARGG